MEKNIVENEIIIGEFKPKRKFLNFVSAISSARIRLLQNSAFLKGEKIAGNLEGVIFKITICDEGTINFEEVDTNRADKAMIKRLIDEIDEIDVTGYAEKFVLSNIEFNDAEGHRCYLEVEHQKPIDRLSSILDELSTEKKQLTTISDRGMSLLDSLFSSESDEELEGEFEGEYEESLNEDKPEIVETKSNFLEDTFKKMTDDKIMELKSRIDSSNKEIARCDIELKNTKNKLEKEKENLELLESRLMGMYPGDEANGYVFFVSEFKKSDIELDDNTKQVAGKIADLMNLRKELLFKHLTEGHYDIKIVRKENIQEAPKEVEQEILLKIKNIDVLGKLNLISSNHLEYRGSLTWHQIVDKMIRSGFEQDTNYDKLCGSNSYESHEVEKVTENNESVIEIPTTDFKAKKLMSFDSPTDLVVVGNCDLKNNSDVEITDDYYNFEVMVDRKHIKGYRSTGFISIMTIAEYKKFYNKLPNDDYQTFLLKGFIGDIEVGALIVQDMNDKVIYSDAFEFNDYIIPQVDPDSDLEDVSVFLNFPKGTNIIEMKNKELPI